MNEARQQIIRQDLFSYFQKQLTDTRRRHRFPLSEITEVYLAHLLAGFLRSEALPDGKNGSLALQYLSALQEESGLRRVTILRQLGDVALYISGFFSESLNRRLVDVDYYIMLGGKAYHMLALHLNGELERAEIFRELSDKFSLLVSLFADIGEAARLNDDRDLLKLYEQYLATGNQRLRHRLMQLGLIPDKPASEQ